MRDSLYSLLYWVLLLLLLPTATASAKRQAKVLLSLSPKTQKTEDRRQKTEDRRQKFKVDSRGLFSLFYMHYQGAPKKKKFESDVYLADGH
jgi:hypothetical protein